MDDRLGSWHVIYVEAPDQPDDWLPEVLHPDSCGISYIDGFGLQRICEVQHELDAVGYDAFFDGGVRDGGPVGWFRIRQVVRIIPGTPSNSGWSELDIEWEVLELSP